ncbi:hypothetical protein UFOVP831_4 [uncultured Caudovirales phage]|uniref:Uncharacterized protein n=1 Tax=uncultured Caudovirales phage TaxID=2100421 RepID=A0A6J5P4W7_9CAUD|nr:hypothetical protein UFOVP831_4 [uncultured Caudovirales phage]
MRYSLQIPSQDEKQFMAVYAESAFRVHKVSQDIGSGLIHMRLELPNCDDEIWFLQKMLEVGKPLLIAQESERPVWLLYLRDQLQRKEYFLEKTFSERLAESASKRILKEEEEQKTKEQEEQRAKEEEDRKLKKIKDEEDAKLTALISYFYNRN